MDELSKWIFGLMSTVIGAAITGGIVWKSGIEKDLAVGGVRIGELEKTVEKNDERMEEIRNAIKRIDQYISNQAAVEADRSTRRNV